MHELPVTESILNIVLSHARANKVRKIVRINLIVGELSDLEDEWIQRYFDYLSKDTIARDAKLNITRAPVILKCDACANEFQVDIKQQKDIVCPECSNKSCSLVSGREYYIKDMEVQ